MSKVWTTQPSLTEKHFFFIKKMVIHTTTKQPIVAQARKS